jgi:hypothetical protein
LKRARGRRGGGTKARPDPLQQGDCDGLCGLYTVLNAIRLALHPAGGLSNAQEEALKFVLVQAAGARWNFSTLFAGGLSTAQLRALLRIGLTFTKEMTGSAIVFDDSSCRKLSRGRYALRTVLLQLTRCDNPVIIAGIEGKMSHWSLITRVTRHYIVFHDSDQTTRLALRHCRLGPRPKSGRNPRYWISVHGVLRLSSNLPVARCRPMGSAISSALWPKIEWEKA